MCQRCVDIPASANLGDGEEAYAFDSFGGMNFEADGLFEDAHVNLGIRKALKTNLSKNRPGVGLWCSCTSSRPIF